MNNGIDFAKMLKVADTAYIAPLTRNASRQITEQDVKKAVVAMSQAGYIFCEKTIEAVAEYLRGYGVLLSGNVGIGKTLFFKVLNDRILHLDFNEMLGWTQEELCNTLAGLTKREVLIDDIGSGGAIGKDYGRSYDVLLTILNKRQWLNERTHFTTNLTNNELVSRFDARVVDRIYGMAKCFRLPDIPSLREARSYTFNNI